MLRVDKPAAHIMLLEARVRYLEKRNAELEAALRRLAEVLADTLCDLRVEDIPADDADRANEMLLLLEWLARRGDDPIWQGLQVNYCPATMNYTYFGYRASKEITREAALALLREPPKTQEGCGDDEGTGTNKTTSHP